MCTIVTVTTVSGDLSETYVVTTDNEDAAAYKAESHFLEKYGEHEVKTETRGSPCE